MSLRPSPVAIKLFLCAVSLVGFGIGALFFWRGWRMSHTDYVVVAATVVDEVMGSDSDGDDEWTYTVEYEDDDHVSHEMNVTRSNDQYDVGDMVSVQYDPSDPDFAMLEGEESSHIIVGVVFMALGVIGFFVSLIRRV